MARKRRPAQDIPRAPVAPPAAAALPPEAAHGGWTAFLLALMMFVAPAIGSPTELMLQDTLKSIVVSTMTLVAALLLFLQLRGRSEPLRWHAVLWLPLMLCAYALGSMVWSHRYLGGVEAVRWFVFAVIVWLGLNTLTRPRLSWLAWGVHGGALVAAIWAAAQFWGGFSLFPQGPNPGSTFINRNFFAEFVVCTLPFGMLLLARARVSSQVLLLAASNGFIVTTILMTGTRAALMALWLQLLLVWPLVAWRCRGQLAWPQWSRLLRMSAVTVMLGTVVLLGMLPSSNPKILEEERGVNALQRGASRTQSIGPKDYSLGVRMVMWRATLNAIKARPINGLGAGAWESEIPLYQAEGSQLETDYYVHNEFLQMVAEYGLVGWAFLLSLLAYLAHAAWRSWRQDSREAREDQPWRAVLLTSLLALLVVSNIGFPWRMAATGALFALCLGGLAASDARLGWRVALGVRPLRWSPRIANACVAATLACLALALYISQQAAEAERKLVQAAKLALTLTASGRGNAPEMEGTRREILKLVREGIAINPHYRKITPMVADELARWGDWRDATWIWESVLGSRPYVVAIIANAARGHASLGEMDKALAELERAKKIQPRAPAVRSLEVIMLARSGQEAKAYALAKEALAAGLYDYDLVNALFVLAMRAKEFPVAEKALKLRMNDWPENKARGLFQLGMLYAVDMKKPAEAVETLRQAVALANEAERAEMLAQMPPEIRAQVAGSAPAAPQTSARSK
ncbi:O-antigen ligase family protein [Ramlibacter sp. XY19]|uniref:O-antigen ligase family protein n=1 Tax=Ramlibacter paludis TaxID=2908000 RepID=UPI0023DCAF13|nr:O-antigen ligase family protein [Ramlibacter paludis]MCG2593576.1 O-antigen ligase family protein [Ramlibacter paludis]